jgi:SAM-dependent methyltransferase
VHLHLISETFRQATTGALAWAFQNVLERGLVRTVKVATSAAADLSFDWRHGTNTMRWVKADNLGSMGENRIHSVHYQASKARPLWTLLNELDLPRNSGFVDFGAGKGRVLLIAALCGFQRIIGVEFSPELCECARRNAEIFQRRNRLSARIEIVLADAAVYPIQPDQQVFFMYNPFDEVVMAQVLANLRRSVEESPRKIWLIYNTPRHHDVIDAAGVFPSCSRRDIGGTEFLVYANR